MKSVTLGAVLPAVLGAICCAPYSPSLPSVAQGAELRAEITSVHVLPRELIVRVRVLSQRRVALAALAFSETEQPCGSGFRPSALAVEGERRWLTVPTPLSPDSRIEVRSRLLDSHDLVDHRNVDLSFVEQDGAERASVQCLRLPITRPERPLVVSAGPYLSGGVAADFAAEDAAGGVASAAYFLLGTGLRQPRWRLNLKSGIGRAFCVEEVCPPSVQDGETRQHSSFAVPAGAGVDLFPWTARTFGLGFGVEYGTLFAWQTTYEGPRTLFVQAPGLAVHFAIYDLPQGYAGLADGLRTPSAELSVPFRLWAVRESGHWQLDTTLGFALAIHGG